MSHSLVGKIKCLLGFVAVIAAIALGVEFGINVSEVFMSEPTAYHSADGAVTIRQENLRWEMAAASLIMFLIALVVIRSSA